MKKFTSALLHATLAGTIVGLASSASAQTPFGATPFAIVGHIQKFTLDSGTPGSSRLSSARMMVNGINVVIPNNLIIQMPASYLTADDIFVMAKPTITERLPSEACPGSAGTLRSGLAVLDCDGSRPAALASFEAEIAGNIVGNVYIAGLVKVTQQALNVGNGYIQKIDRNTGEIFVSGNPDAVPGSTSSPTDARLKLNDAIGRFGRATSSPSAPPSPALPEDGRFTADTDNPTMHAESGFPMCVPRSAASDPLCPDSNRPLAPGGAPSRLFVMDTVPLVTTVPVAITVQACPACDPSQQAPFKEGDYITYQGTVASDAKGLYTSAHTVVASVGIFTKPGDKTRPAYVSQEVSLIGTMGPTLLPFNQEGQDRLKVEAFSTDPSRELNIYAIDVNPADGSKTLRFLGKPNKRQGALGRYRLILGKNAAALKAGGTTLGAPRELVITFDKGDGTTFDGMPAPTGPLAANGLVWGQFTAPVGEYIFPENTVMGEPRIPNNFECLSFLQLGSGPLGTRGLTGPNVGRLTPWPGTSGGPATVFCGP